MSLNKVLEHTMSPEKMILKIRKLLKLNGIFYLEVPDQLSATKGKEREELMVEHLHVFSKMSLKNLMVRNKFKILQLKQIKEPQANIQFLDFSEKLKNVNIKIIYPGGFDGHIKNHLKKYKYDPRGKLF